MSQSGAQRNPVSPLTVGAFAPQCNRAIEFAFIGRDIAGRPTVRAHIGGGMADVFRATGEHLGSDVAIELLKPRIASDELRARMVQEARATAHMTRSFSALVCLLGLIASCVVADIDAHVSEHGTTDYPSSTGSSDSGLDTSSSTSTSTSSSASDSSAASPHAPDTSSTGESTTTAHSGSSGSSSTGSAPPICGDGIVEGDEACDDGNATPGDGCQECAKDSIVFVTSELYQGFALGGLFGADQRCRSLAAQAGLERPLTFTAWLSTPTTSAADRLVHSRGRYILVNGLVVAQNWEGLTSGTLENPIMVDENSDTHDTFAWTGTLASGKPALGTDFCEGWDDDSGLLKLGGAGLTASIDTTWAFFEDTVCDSGARLYCFQQ